VTTSVFWRLFYGGLVVFLVGILIDNRWVGAAGFSLSGFAVLVIGPRLLTTHLASLLVSPNFKKGGN